MDPIEYCDVCFFRGKTNLCETFKGTFTKISPIHFSQQNRLERILNESAVRPKLVERRWTCILDKSQRKKFLDSLWGLGITVHTLEDHVKILSKLYKPEVRNLGSLTEIKLPSYESWKEFDPQLRDWKPLEVSKKKSSLVSKVKIGAVIKCTVIEGDRYFRTVSKEGKGDLVPLQRRAAYNIILTQLEPAKEYWQTDEKNQTCFIQTKSLENLPEEISSTLERLKSSEQKVAGFFSFDAEDFELVKAVLALAKIGLEKSSERLELTKDEKARTAPILIEDIERDRIDALTVMISELGGKVESSKDQLTVIGKVDSAKLSFIQSGKSTQDRKLLSVSVSVLEDPQRVSDLLSVVKKRLGLLTMPVESLVYRHWPIINDADLEYVVQSVIEYSKMDKNLALGILRDQKKFEKVKEWNSKIKEGKIRSSLDTVALGKILKMRK